MRAVVVTGPGADPICTDFAEPQNLPGELTMDLVGAGIHNIVRSLAAGRHYGSDGTYPLVPGVDAVARTTDGRLVYTGFLRAPWGTMAERLSARLGIQLSEGADPLAVAAGMNPALSSWLPLAGHIGEFGGLGTVLVLGATGMSGAAAVQIAFALGADRVVAAGRDAASLARLAGFGAVTVQLGTDQTEAQLAASLAVAAPSIVLDYVWGPVAEVAFAALGRRGLGDDDADIVYTQIGAMAGPTAALPAQLLRSRRIRVVGSGAGSVSTDRIVAELPKVMALIADGRIEVPYTAFPLERIADAWAHAGPGRAVVVPLS